MQAEQKPIFKHLVYDQFARVGKALAHAHRLALLDLLVQGEHSVEALAKETGLPIATASQHLQILRAARLVETRRVGVVHLLPSGIGECQPALAGIARLRRTPSGGD